MLHHIFSTLNIKRSHAKHRSLKVNYLWVLISLSNLLFPFPKHLLVG